jgi:hypothetical protein
VEIHNETASRRSPGSAAAPPDRRADVPRNKAPSALTTPLRKLRSDTRYSASSLSASSRRCLSLLVTLQQLFSPLQRLGQSRLTDRFEQIAHGVAIERSHGIFIISGYEYDERQNWYYWEEPATSRNKLGNTEKLSAFRRLDRYARAIDENLEPKANFGKLIEYEKLISPFLDGRSV